jgi:predicted outer membrane repeat protein
MGTLHIGSPKKAQMIEPFEPRIAPATIIVTSLADSGSGSLRAAIAEANEHNGADLIAFARGLTGTIQLTSGLIEISDALTIKGPGAAKLAIDAEFQSRIFLVSDRDGAEDSPLAVSGLTFLHGKHAPIAGESDRGGAIVSIESLYVNGCVFAENVSHSSAGAVEVLQVPDGVPVSIDIRNTTFDSNSCELFSGGAIGANVGGSITLKNTLFTGNSAGLLAGGAVFQAGTGQVLLLQNCKFLENRADEAGGAFLGGGPGSITIVRNTLFADNEASDDNGGGAVIFGGRVVIEKSTFRENIAQSQGGGLDVTTFSSLVIRSSQFIDNACLARGSGGGGLEVSVSDGSNAHIIGSIVAGNTASQGGGIQVAEQPGKVQIISSQIMDNLAINNGGGVLRLEDSETHKSADLSIIRSQLTDNTSADDNGGAVAALGIGEFSMLFSQVLRNSSQSDGGGISLFGTGPATIIGSIIAQNSAGEQGGGIFSAAPLELIDTRIFGNSADTGGGIAALNDLKLTSSIVTANFADIAGGIFHTRGTDLILDDSKVVRNFSSDGKQIVES